MHAGVEAAVACHRIGHPGSVVASVGSKELVVVLESCHNHVGEHFEGHRRRRVASGGHRQARQHHQQRQLHSRYRKVLARSSKPRGALACEHEGLVQR